MKRLSILIFITMLTCTFLSASNLTEDFVFGNPEIESIHSMTFGPESILFIGDSDAAQIVAIDLSGQKKAVNEKMAISNIEEELTKLLGTTSDQIQIIDLAVDPNNENVYIAVNHSSGKSLLFLVNNDSLEALELSLIHI